VGRVVILGGGYAGLHCLRALEASMGRDLDAGRHHVTLVSRDPYHTYHGWTTEVLSGRLPAGRTLSPLAPIARGRFLEGLVTGVDLDAREVAVETADGATVLPFDHLLLATGSVDPFGRIPGLAEHGWRLKDTRDMQALAARLDAIGSGAAPLPAKVAVVGGGMAGVETASAIAERVGGDRVALLASGPVLLGDLARDYGRLAANAADTLRRQGVEVRPSSRVASIGPGEVVLEDGTRFPCDMAVVAAGIEFPVLAGTERLSRTGTGRLRGDGFLRASGADGVWVAGDIAEVARPGGEGNCPVDALWAMKQGRHAGTNIARAIAGKPPKPFRFRGMGQAAGLADRQGISELYGMQFTGRLAWLLRVAFFSWFMPSRRHGFSVLAELLGYRKGARTAGPPGPPPRRARPLTADCESSP